MRRLLTAVMTAVVAVGAGVLAWAEYVHWRASHQWLGETTSPGGTEAIVVLGYRNGGRRANAVNRYRVRAGLRSMDPRAQHSVLVLCGGRVGGDVPEAELMAAYARDRRGYTGPVRLETESTTTRENIENAIPLVSDAQMIKIVSNAPHAEVGREYLWQLRPDLAARLVRGADYRFAETPLLKVASAVIAARHRARKVRRG